MGDNNKIRDSISDGDDHMSDEEDQKEKQTHPQFTGEEQLNRCEIIRSTSPRASVKSLVQTISDSSVSQNIIQVANVAPTATLEQLTTLFSFLGDIVNIELYQSADQNSETNFKVCFVEFSNPSSVLMAQHLTNTVFIDRALIVLPYNKCKIPDRETAISELVGSKFLTNFNFGVVSQVTTGPGGIQLIATIDPRLTALGLPQYPHLPINTDPVRVEEIRRTLYIGNLDSTIPPDQVMKFFNDIGEVKYIRMAGDDTQPTRFAFVEYNHQSSIANALQYNGTMLGSRTLKINHSNNAIVKPQIKFDSDDVPRRLAHDSHSASREFGPRDIRPQQHQLPSRYDRTDRGERTRDRDRDRYHDRRGSPRDSRSHRSRSRDKDISRSRRSRSRDRPSRRSRSKDGRSSRRRSRSKDSRRRRSSSRSHEHSSKSSSRHRKTSRR